MGRSADQEGEQGLFRIDSSHRSQAEQEREVDLMNNWKGT